MELIRRRCRHRTGHPPILFVHGAYVDARIWDVYFLDFFVNAGFDAWALSLRGHGKSRYEPVSWSPGLSDYTDDVNRAIEQIGEPPVLVGHSMGGLVVQQVSGNSDIPVHSAVLMAAVPPKGMYEPALRLAQAHPALFHKLSLLNASPRWMWEHWLSAADVRKMFFSETTPLAQVKRFFSFFQSEPPRGLIDLLLFCPPAQPGFKGPMLVMGAEADIIIPPDFVQRTAEAFSAELKILPGMGHAMMLEENWKDAARCIEDWLKHGTRHRRDNHESRRI